MSQPNTFALSAWVRWCALLALCAAYLQGGLVKALSFDGAVAEMLHFGMSPPALVAILVIALELGASLMILFGIYRWIGALALAAFTLIATFLANRFWEVPEGITGMLANAFFEHIGLVGGFILIAWYDRIELRARAREQVHP